jgi:FkbM family methyltransferase
MIALLDYPDAEIKLYCETESERTKRVPACQKEPETCDWISSLAPGVFYDIGANVGSYALLAAHLGHRVSAFEPHGPTYARLQQNIRLNRLEVDAYNILLDEEDHYVSFVWSSDEVGSALHSVTDEEVRVAERVLAHKLDTIVSKWRLPKPEYLKIDTDGHELAILLGATETLRGVKSLLIEMDYDDITGLSLIPPLLEGAGFQETGRFPHGLSTIENRVYAR